VAVIFVSYAEVFTYSSSVTLWTYVCHILLKITDIVCPDLTSMLTLMFFCIYKCQCQA